MSFENTFLTSIPIYLDVNKLIQIDVECCWKPLKCDKYSQFGHIYSQNRYAKIDYE